jgi:hypothetical protein
LTFTNATSRLQIACRERHGPPHVTNQGPLHLLIGLPPVGFHREGEPRTSCLLIRTPEGRSGTLLVALAGGTLILAGFGVVGFFVFAYSWYTRVGSGINQHPYGDVDHSSGRETPWSSLTTSPTTSGTGTAESPVITANGIHRARTAKTTMSCA